MHESSVVYAKDGPPTAQGDGRGSISADKRFSLSDIDVSNVVNADGTLKPRSDIELSLVYNSLEAVDEEDDGMIKV
jgi:hypothetical protein